MQQVAIDPNGPHGGWPRLAERDAATIRLVVCRQLLGILAEEGGCGVSDDFAEVGRFLSQWDEAQVRADPTAFCQDAVRLLSLMLAHVDRDSFVDSGRPALALG